MSFVKRRKQAHLYRRNTANEKARNERKGTAETRVSVSAGRADSQGQGEAEAPVACPYCKARVGKRCVSRKGTFLSGYHKARKEKAA